MEIGSRGGVDIMHVWNGPIHLDENRLECVSARVSPRVYVCARTTGICICVCKLTDEYTKGICVCFCL